MEKLLRSLFIPFGVVLFLALGACNVKPSYILGKKKMSAVMKDMMLAEAYVRSMYVPDSVKRYYFESVLSKHNVSQNRYDSSYVWYSKNIALFQPIMEKVSNELKTEAAHYELLTNDSIYQRNKLFPSISDAWGHEVRRVPFYASEQGEYHKLIRLYSLKPLLPEEVLQFSFKFIPISHKAEEAHDTLGLRFRFATDSLLSLSFDTLLSEPSGVHSILFPRDTVFSSKTKLSLEIFLRRGKSTEGAVFLPVTMLDSIRLQSKRPE